MTQEKPPVPTRTNNFELYFVHDLLTPDQKARLRDPSQTKNPKLAGAAKNMDFLENNGKHWTRFKEQYADLYFVILDQIAIRIKQLNPDFNRYKQLLVDRQIEEADKFNEESRLEKRWEAWERRTNPMLNFAFDVIVREGVDPKRLLM